MEACCSTTSIGPHYSEARVQNDCLSAVAAVRDLRDQLRAKLEQNEDYRAWKALDEAMRQLEPQSLPRAVNLAVGAIELSTTENLWRA